MLGPSEAKDEAGRSDSSRSNRLAEDVTVLLPVYAGDDPDHFDTAIESLAAQTRPAAELLVVADGSLPEAIETVLDHWRERYPGRLIVHRLPENRGLGSALRAGVERASNDLVARMDADDIAVPNRIETQSNHLAANPEVDVLGGYVQEFADDPADGIAVRWVPLDHEDIREFGRSRSPMNHGTVIFRRASVLAAGNYRPVDRMEDYDLWSRLLLDGARLQNLPRVLVKVRAGADLYGRRGGLEYAREEVRQQTEFLRRGFIGPVRWAFNLSTRFSVRLLPAAARRRVYGRYRAEPDAAASPSSRSR